jgi:hypothetical protein
VSKNIAMFIAWHCRYNRFVLNISKTLCNLEIKFQIYIRSEVWQSYCNNRRFRFGCYLYYLARRRLSFTLEITITRANGMVENCGLLGYYAASSGNCNYHYSMRNNPDERILVYFAAEAWTQSEWFLKNSGLNRNIPQQTNIYSKCLIL